MQFFGHGLPTDQLDPPRHCLCGPPPTRDARTAWVRSSSPATSVCLLWWPPP